MPNINFFAVLRLSVNPTKTFLMKKKEQKQGQMNKGGKFIKKLWCCVGERVLQVV